MFFHIFPITFVFMFLPNLITSYCNFALFEITNEVANTTFELALSTERCHGSKPALSGTNPDGGSVKLRCFKIYPGRTILEMSFFHDLYCGEYSDAEPYLQVTMGEGTSRRIPPMLIAVKKLQCNSRSLDCSTIFASCDTCNSDQSSVFTNISVPIDTCFDFTSRFKQKLGYFGNAIGGGVERNINRTGSYVKLGCCADDSLLITNYSMAGCKDSDALSKLVIPYTIKGECWQNPDYSFFTLDWECHTADTPTINCDGIPSLDMTSLPNNCNDQCLDSIASNFISSEMETTVIDIFIVSTHERNNAQFWIGIFIFLLVLLLLMICFMGYCFMKRAAIVKEIERHENAKFKQKNYAEMYEESRSQSDIIVTKQEKKVEPTEIPEEPAHNDDDDDAMPSKTEGTETTS